MAVQYRYNPTQMANLVARLSYNTLFNGLNSTSLTAGFRFGPHALGTTWVTRFNAETETTRGNQLRGDHLFEGSFRKDISILACTVHQLCRIGCAAIWTNFNHHASKESHKAFVPSRLSRIGGRGPARSLAPRTLRESEWTP